MMQKLRIPVLVFLFFTEIVPGQIPSDKKTLQKVQVYLHEIEKAGFNGTFLIKVKSDSIAAGFGYSDRENKTPNSPSTIFDIGSLTKQFTAAAILKLEMQGKLKTEDKISSYFENIPADKSEITIHDLLRHQSGLISNVGKDYEPVSKPEFLQKVFASALRFEVGSSFSYSNIGYSLLAMIIEKVSGQSYENYLYKNLWHPAKMESTGYSRPRFDLNTIATGYDQDSIRWGKPVEKAWENDAPYWHLKGNGGILSSAEDLYKWHVALGDTLILSKSAQTKLYNPKLRPGESHDGYYAYGWDVSKTGRNTTRVWHNGSNRIFYSDFLRFTDEDVVLIMLTNQMHLHFTDLNEEISRIIFLKDYLPVIPVADNEANRNFTTKIISILKSDGFEKAKAEYHNKKQNEDLIEIAMSDEGFNVMDDNPELCLLIFQMNAIAHPDSWKVYRDLGEGYLKLQDNAKALIHFTKGRELNPENNFMKNMIDKINSGK